MQVWRLTVLWWNKDGLSSDPVWPWRWIWRLRARHIWYHDNDIIGPFLGKRFAQPSFFKYELKHYSCHVRVRFVELCWYSSNCYGCTRGKRFNGRDYFRFTARSFWYASSRWKEGTSLDTTWLSTDSKCSLHLFSFSSSADKMFPLRSRAGNLPSC